MKLADLNETTDLDTIALKRQMEKYQKLRKSFEYRAIFYERKTIALVQFLRRFSSNTTMMKLEHNVWAELDEIVEDNFADPSNYKLPTRQAKLETGEDILLIKSMDRDLAFRLPLNDTVQKDLDKLFKWDRSYMTNYKKMDHYGRLAKETRSKLLK